MEGGRVGNIYTFEDAYKYLGYDRVLAHPGHPPVPPEDVSEPCPSIMDIEGKATHAYAAGNSPSGDISVQDISKRLYFLAPNFEKRAPLPGITASQSLVEPHYAEIRECVSLLCQSFVDRCDEVGSTLDPCKSGRSY
jgi:hypothetical protein